jgi:hypothetical protein
MRKHNSPPHCHKVFPNKAQKAQRKHTKEVARHSFVEAHHDGQPHLLRPIDPGSGQSVDRSIGLEQRKERKGGR